MIKDVDQLIRGLQILQKYDSQFDPTITCDPQECLSVHITMKVSPEDEERLQSMKWTRGHEWIKWEWIWPG